jgi:hypothetical protein
VGQRAHDLRRALPATPAAGGPDAALGQPARRQHRPGHAPEVQDHARRVPRAGAHRHAPARRARVRGVRRVPRGVVPPGGAHHPAQLRQGGHLPRPVPRRGDRAHRGQLADRQRGVRLPEQPARHNAVVPRPHARHDAHQRLRRPHRHVPVARRLLRPARRRAARPGTDAR